MDIITTFKNIKPPTLESLWIQLAIVTYCVVATIILPGKWKQGVPLKDGSRVWYKLNGLPVVILSIVLFFITCKQVTPIQSLGFFDGSYVFNHYGEMLTTSVLLSAFLSFLLYIRAELFLPRDSVNYNPQNKNPIVNYWAGVELNPTIYGFEIKEFWYRPGFVLWLYIDASALIHQYETYQHISIPMMMFQLIAFIYIIDCFIHEEGVILMFDIIEENFGFMLCWGDFTWIPFVFSLPSLYCVNRMEMSMLQLVFTAICFTIGYIIFRGTNDQKAQFKENPRKPIWGKVPETIQSPAGRKLLVSGWWGVARKINYLGDILIAISMTAAAGYTFVLPHLYPIYLTILLIDRARRDDARCRVKHKEAWTEYCERVPYCIVPYVY